MFRVPERIGIQEQAKEKIVRIFLVKWLVAVPLLLVCGVFFALFFCIGFFGWISSNLAWGIFGLMHAVVNVVHLIEDRD